MSEEEAVPEPKRQVDEAVEALAEMAGKLAEIKAVKADLDALMPNPLFTGSSTTSFTSVTMPTAASYSTSVTLVGGGGGGGIARGGRVREEKVIDYKEYPTPVVMRDHTNGKEHDPTPCHKRVRIPAPPDGEKTWACTRHKGHTGNHEAGVGDTGNGSGLASWFR